MSDHISIGQGGRFQCNHCGTSHNQHGPEGRPVELWAMSALAKAFTDQHVHCPKPKRELCPFCFSPEHAWTEHVNATTSTADDWPGCGDTGLSSKTIWHHMMGRPMPARCPCEPADPDDFGRCYRLLHAPWAKGWTDRIGEMARYPMWSGLVSRWGDLEALYVEEVPSGEAPRLYALMKGLRGER